MFTEYSAEDEQLVGEVLEFVKDQLTHTTDKRRMAEAFLSELEYRGYKVVRAEPT